jgi:YD repeat-containing protein
MTWSADGVNLLESVDPEGNTTIKSYDSENNLIKVIDPMLYETSYIYQGRLITSTTNALNQTTTYQYTLEGELNSAGQPQPGGLLKSAIDPLNRTTTYQYNPNGQTVSVTDVFNRTTLYSYDQLGRRTDTTDHKGVITHNEYNSVGWLVRVTQNYDPNRPKNDQNLYNLVTEYEYDEKGHQTVVRNTLGHETLYVYDTNGRLVQTTNALNQVSINAYDKTGELVQSIDVAGNLTTYEKDDSGRLVSTLNPLGHGSVNTFDLQQNSTTTTNLLGNVTVTYYDMNNRVVRVVNNMSGETLTTYDANGNAKTRTDSLGRVTLYEYDALGRVVRQVTNYDANRSQNDQGQFNIVTEYDYDVIGNQVQLTDTHGRITFNEYDSYGRLIRQTQNFDASRLRNEAGQYNIITEYLYDADGNQSHVVDTYNMVSYLEYDALGRLVKQTQNYDPAYPLNDQNVYNLVTEYRYDALGNQTHMIDPEGRITLKEYDALGRMTRQTQNYDVEQDQNYQNQYNIVTEYDYDAVGRQSKVKNTYGRVTYYEYDQAGQVIRITHNYDANRVQNDENLFNVITTFVYDEAGNQIKEIDTYGKVTYYEYDELGHKKSKTENYDSNRSLSEENEYNLVTQYRYNLLGQQTDEIDPNGIITHFEYDAIGRLAASIQNYQAGVNPTAEINVRIEYTYDTQGNRTSRKDPRGNSTTYSYDTLGRLEIETSPLMRSASFAYNGLGKLISKTDGNGTITLFEYDALGRLLLVDYPSGEADVIYTYNVQGQPLTMTDGWGTTSWSYDALERMTSVTNPDGSRVVYSYDALGNRQTLTTHMNATDVTGKTIAYTYDALNRMSVVTDWQGQQIKYAYDAMNRLTKVQLPNGVLSIYEYDTAGRIERVTHTNHGQKLAMYEYRYDPTGNRLQAIETTFVQKMDPSFIPPTQFAAVEEGYQSISLAWPPSMIDEATYKMERSTDGQNWREVVELDASARYYVEQGLLRHTDYWYRLTAYNRLGENQVQMVRAKTGWDEVHETNPYTVEESDVTIISTYDALNRPKTVQYSNGAVFSYRYDPAGNTIEAVKSIAGQITTSVYSYDEDNQIVTGQENSGPTWHYQFDGNGSLIEARPEDQVGSGARRYSYNATGQLDQVETHDGTAYQVQVEMDYNGLGQRLSLTAHEAGQSLTSQSLLDGQTLLAATVGAQSTFYLPGIGEHGQDWRYYLADGTNSVRQLVDQQGAVVLSRSFTPWGVTLEQAGEEDIVWGYLGGVLDAATGLIYVGNGQYYDPVTGRFLSRVVHPGAPNPYVPLQGNPPGMIVGPLALLVLTRGKRKGGKIEQFLVVVIVSLAVSLTVSGCTTGGGETPTQPPSTPTEPQPTQPGSGGTSTSTQPPTTTPTPTPTCTPIPTGTPTTAPVDIEFLPYPGQPAFDSYGAWAKTVQRYKEIRDWFIGNPQEEALEESLDPNNYGPRFKDEILLSFIIAGEFGIYSGRTIYTNCLKALHNQYNSQDLCGGNCDSVKKQLVWLSTKQMMRAKSAQFFMDNYKAHLEIARGLKNGSYSGTDNWEWGNYTKGSPFGQYVRGEQKEPAYNYVDHDYSFFNPITDKDYAGFVVFTHKQDQACGSCLGW